MYLATLEQTKAALSIDEGDDDLFLDELIQTSTEIILTYLKIDPTTVDISTDEVVIDTTVPRAAKTAMIMLVGFIMKNRDKDIDKSFAFGQLPIPVSSLLYQYRVPTLA